MSQLKPTRGIQLNKTHLLTRGFVGYWLFNEGSGGKVFDISGNRNSGVRSGTGTIWVPGKFGFARQYNGSDDFDDVVSSVNDLISTKITILVWIKAGGALFNVDGAIVTDVFAPDENVVFNITGYHSDVATNTQIVAGFYDSGWKLVVQTGDFTFGQWVQVVGTYDGSTIKLYIDGLLNNSVSDSSGLPVGTSNWRFGRRWDTGDYFNGLIDHVMIYNRALSASEITLLYREPFCMFEPALNIARISSIVANGFVEITGDLAALSFLTDSAVLRRARGIAGGVAAQSSLAGSIKVSKKISGAIAATSSLSGTLSLVGEVSRSRGSGFKPIEGAERLRGLRRSAFY